MKEKVILEVKKLSKTFANDGMQVHVLSDVDLQIYEGDFTVIMGPSGSGKSTLLYALSGMDRATGGEVLFNGIDLVKAKEKKLTTLRSRDFGFVFQAMHLVNNLTLLENVAVPGYLNKSVPAKDTQKRAKELLERMGLKNVVSHLPSRVSGGEQQRAAIARAVINKPAIVFADEPTGALNKKNTGEVLDLFTSLNQEGQSIIMVTHDVRAALRATRILYLSDGKVIGELSLPPFTEENGKARETQVNAWLSSLEW